MPKNWKTYKLGNLCIKITDGAHHSPKDIGTGGYPMPSVKDLTPFGLNLKSSKRISELDYYKLIKQGCQPIVNDVVIAKDGNSALDTVCIIKKKIEAVLLSSVAIIRPDMKLIDPYFLKCYFSSPAILKYLKSRFISGAAIPRVILKDFKLAEINLPPLPEQKAIASILSAIDDKIENNLAMNKTLEDMAMALYQHWFVDFGPFKEGKFIDSELGLIPEGWQVKPIGDVIDTVGGGTPKTKTKEYWEDGTINWYSPTDLTKSNSLYSNKSAKKITSLGLQKSSARLFPKGSLLMSSRATIGALTINRKEACTNQGFITMIPNENVCVYQLHGWAVDNMNLIISKANGSTFKEISKTNFRALPILTGAKIKEYKLEVSNSYKKIESNLLEIETLTQLRDTLLPKLISGEVRLKEFEKEITAVL